MLEKLEWSSLERRRKRARLVMFYRHTLTQNRQTENKCYIRMGACHLHDNNEPRNEQKEGRSQVVSVRSSVLGLLRS